MADDAENNLSQRIGDLIKQARSSKNSEQNVLARVQLLETATQLIFSDPEGSILDNFLDEMLEFLSEREEKMLNMFTLGFIEKAVKVDPEIIKKVVQPLSWVLRHDTNYNIAIQKSVIVTCTQIYPYILKWAYNKKNDSEVERSWNLFAALKVRILSMLDNQNDGYRVHCVKFMEMMILCQSTKSDFSVIKPGQEHFDLSGFNLIDHRFISQRQMESEMNHGFQRLVDELASSDITSQTLLVILQVLCNVAKQRPERMQQVVSALESLHINLPPTLATHQVKSLRKELRYHILRMLRHPTNFSHHPRLHNLLAELGCSAGEIERHMPEKAEVLAILQKRTALARAAAQASQAGSGAFHQGGPSTSAAAGQKRAGDAEAPGDSKKFKLDDDDYLDEGTAEILRGADGKKDLTDASQKAVDITTDFVLERLSLNVVVKLVTISLFTLPDEMPPAFQSTFTRIDNAEEQKRHLARILAIQLTKEGEGPGIKFIREQKQQQYLARQNARLEGAVIPPTPGREEEKPARAPVETFAKPLEPKKSRITQWNILTNTKELLLPEAQNLSTMAFLRVINNEKRANQGGAFQAQHQLLVRLTSRFISSTNEQFAELLIQFIIQDQKNRAELALLWLNELFVQYGGYNPVLTSKGQPDIKERYIRYDTALCSILGLLFNRKDNKETLFHRILLEVPLVTPAALTWLKKSCLDPVYGAFGMTTLREMILTRPRQRSELLKLLISFAYYEPVDSDERTTQVMHDVRENCVNTAKELYVVDYVRDDLREAVVEMSEQLTQPFAPHDLVAQCRRLGADEARALPDQVAWDEQLVRAALHLFVAMLTVDNSLLMHLAHVTSKAITEVQIITFMCIVQAIKSIDMHSQALLDTIAHCPKGAEPLIARIVNLLTERNAPTPELVDRIRRLHEERSTDIRSLLPILTGLERRELLGLVPKFVMNATYHKSVPLFFKKLIFGRHIKSHDRLMTPVDLLVQLHRCKPKGMIEQGHLVHNLDLLIVDPNGAFQLSKDAMAAAVEELMDEYPVPKLLFHTIQKIHDRHPSLRGFLVNVLNTILEKHPEDADVSRLMNKITQQQNPQARENNPPPQQPQQSISVVN